MDGRSGHESHDSSTAYGARSALEHALSVLDGRLRDIAEEQRELALEAVQIEQAREALRREFTRLGMSGAPKAERQTVVPLVAPVPHPTMNRYWFAECWPSGRPTTAQGIVEVLRRSRGEAMSTASIRSALIEAGWVPNSRNLNALLNATLARLDKTPDCPIRRMHKGFYFYEEG